MAEAELLSIPHQDFPEYFYLLNLFKIIVQKT